jgi:hypothetical protein
MPSVSNLPFTITIKPWWKGDKWCKSQKAMLPPHEEFGTYLPVMEDDSPDRENHCSGFQKAAKYTAD